MCPGVMTGQLRRGVLSPVFWLCTVLFAGVLLINSGIAFSDPSSDVISSYTLAVLNSEPVAMSILPSLPFALSYMEEKKERSLRFSYIRGGVYEYMNAKFVSVILTGFFVAAIGCVWYLLVTSLFMPFAEKSLNVRETVGLQLFLENGRPILYFVCIAFCQCASAAVFTGLTFTASLFFRGKYTVIVLPFLAFKMLTFFDAMLQLNINFRRLFLDLPVAYTALGQVSKKMVFVLSVLFLLWLVAVKKGERDVLDD